MSRDLNSWLLPQNSSGYIVGFRGWYFDTHKLRLMSLCHHAFWPVGAPLECEVPLLRGSGATYVEVNHNIEHDKRVGIFAFKTLEQTLNSDFRQQFIGEVALWGEVAEHEEGYRAQYAYPLTLAVSGYCFPYKEVSEIAKLYGCKYIGESS